MKLKINKACDLSSISVLPPPARGDQTSLDTSNRRSVDEERSNNRIISRNSGTLNGSQSSAFGKSQGSQLRSQASQQSFSQGISSQQGMFSQFSQSSLDEILTNEQRNCSEEKETSMKKLPCLPMAGYSREESQMALQRASSNQLSKWNCTSSADQRSQKNEELERRLWSMENSVNRFAMILDSVQTDIMQVNKGTKEVLMEMEGIRQRLTVNDNLLQQMNKGQEDIKSNLVEGFKSISDQVSQDLFQEKLNEISSAISEFKGQMDVSQDPFQEKLNDIFSAFSALKGQMNDSLQVLKPDLCKTVQQQMQAIACSLKMPLQKQLTPIVVSPKAITRNLKMPEQKHLAPVVVSRQEISRRAIPKQMSPLNKRYSVNSPAFGANLSRMTTRSQVRPEVRGKENLVPKVEVGSWTSVKTEQATITRRGNGHKQKRQSPIELDREWRIPIESDEEINRGLSCLFEEKGTENYLTADVKEETDRILRQARRRKRKSRNIIILN